MIDRPVGARGERSQSRPWVPGSIITGPAQPACATGARRATRGVPVRRPSHRFPSVPSSSSDQAGAPTLLAAERALLAPAMVRAWIVRIGPALGLIAIVLVFALLTDAPARYLSSFNLRIVLSQTVIVALGAIGMTMIIVSGGIDLSVGATIALTGVITALGIGAGWPPSLRDRSPRSRRAASSVRSTAP